MKRKAHFIKMFTNCFFCLMVLMIMLSACQNSNQKSPAEESIPNANLDTKPNEISEDTSMPKADNGNDLTESQDATVENEIVPDVGSTMMREKDGMEMVYVPEGTFMMGIKKEDTDGWDNKQPEMEIYLDAYWIDKYEVSNAQYAKCVADGECTEPGSKSSKTRNNYYGNSEFDNYPVIWVDWNQSSSYCAWAGGRLPSEAEWEKAARGTERGKYPWGNENPTSELVNYNENVGDTTAVDSYPEGISPYGAFNMAGNVSEWVNDRWSNKYDTSGTRNPTGPQTGAYRVLRGGWWGSVDRGIRSGFRARFNPYIRGSYRGFRCAFPSEKADNANDLTETQEEPVKTEQVFDVGSMIVREKDGMEMVYVPEGMFTMGSNGNDPDVLDEGTPEWEVYLDAYWIDKYEVTNAQYAKCVAEGACKMPYYTESSRRDNYYGNPEYNNYPVVWVNEEHADAYCAWVGGRLPTEAEWEKAARGPNGNKYPWGNEAPNCHLANYNQGTYENPTYCVGDTSEVGSYPEGASYYGAMDMAGNVWEWVNDFWSDQYDTSISRNPTGPEYGSHRIFRGGSWDDDESSVSSIIRYLSMPILPKYKLSGMGFRCAFPPGKAISSNELTESQEASVENEQMLGVGSTMVREKDGMEMVYVPDGTFVMGSNNDPDDVYDYEKPERQVYLDAYWIDKYEVSNAQYAKCVADGKCYSQHPTSAWTRGTYYGNPEYDNYPVIFVDWFEANAYCEWAGGRLPTEAEWEKAARGPNGHKYPWGDEAPNCDRANYNQGSNADPMFCVRGTSEVGSYPKAASVYGALDMAGNVYEWVNDWFADSYDANDTDNPTGPSTGIFRVFRGGSWNFGDNALRSTSRPRDFPDFTDEYLGFRCAFPAENADKANDITASQEAPVEDEQVLGVGSTMVREKDGMEMVYVPDGTFVMGSTEGESDERPVRENVFLNAYWIDKYEVSNAQYAKCVADGACTKPGLSMSFTRDSYYSNDEFADYPVIHVDWNQASVYCAWAGGRLPSEAEWEKAARGPNGSKYPWGDESPNCSLAKYKGCKRDTTEVGSHPDGASYYGAMDMAGNVWEWVNDWYADSYDVHQLNNPLGPSSGTFRVQRGGSWFTDGGDVRSTYRSGGYPDQWNFFIGFRCAFPTENADKANDITVSQEATVENEQVLGGGSTL